MKPKDPGRRGWIQMLGLSVLLFVAVAVLSAIPFIRDWELRFADTFFRLSPSPKQKSEVVLVTLDDETLQRYGRWPWSRTLLAKLTSNLVKGGASVVGLDILLSEPQTPDADRALENALQSGRVVIVDKIASYWDGPHWMEPLPQFSRAAAGVGHAQAPLEQDSVCRRYPPLELSLDGPRWAFALEVARRVDAKRTADFLSSYGLDTKDETRPVLTAKPVLVPIPFRRDGFDTIPAWTVIQGLDSPILRGRPVLVGFGTTEIGDRLSTPLHPEFPTPGVEVHAQILDGILTGRSLREVSVWAGSLAVLITCGVAVGVFRSWRGMAAVAVFAVAALAVGAAALLAFVMGGRGLPAGSMILAVILAPLLVYTAEFVQVEHSVNQQLLGLRAWLAWQAKQPVTREREDL